MNQYYVVFMVANFFYCAINWISLQVKTNEMQYVIAVTISAIHSCILFLQHPLIFTIFGRQTLCCLVDRPYAVPQKFFGFSGVVLRTFNWLDEWNFIQRTCLRILYSDYCRFDQTNGIFLKESLKDFVQELLDFWIHSSRRLEFS